MQASRKYIFSDFVRSIHASSRRRIVCWEPTEESMPRQSVLPQSDLAMNHICCHPQAPPGKLSEGATCCHGAVKGFCTRSNCERSSGTSISRLQVSLQRFGQSARIHRPSAVVRACFMVAVFFSRNMGVFGDSSFSSLPRPRGVNAGDTLFHPGPKISRLPLESIQ